MATTAGTHAGPQGGLAPAAGSGEETQSPGRSTASSRSPAAPSPPPNLAASRPSTPPQSRPPQQPRQTPKLLQRGSRRGAGVARQGHPLASDSPPYAAAGRHPPLAPAPPPAVAVQQIQPSVLNVSIGDCSFVPAEILGGAAVHWRQRAPFKSRARDRQSSYNPQLCCVRGARTRNVVRRSLGDHSSTRARTRGGPIRRATPCMIIAGGSGARATADSASPHALWPAAARCRAPCLRRMEADSRL
mmetsp:Transcript_11258/g.33638  ORF Transcript_11258/g.33638 Transcript_11258/m.33638 type:complete len:245 (-) Transcript_11258:162-896(-)